MDIKRAVKWGGGRVVRKGLSEQGPPSGATKNGKELNVQKAEGRAQQAGNSTCNGLETGWGLACERRGREARVSRARHERVMWYEAYFWCLIRNLDFVS